MATPDILEKQDRLVRFEPSRQIGRLDHRQLYLLPALRDDLNDRIIPHPKFKRSALSPAEQVSETFDRFCAGEKMTGAMARLIPTAKGVWELKLPDIRIFGWFWRKGVFVAAYAEWANDVKGRDRSKGYNAYIRKTARTIRSLPLDEPKYQTGDIRYVL